MPAHIATWNPARDVWETDRMSLFSEHPDVFSETWPKWGLMRSGEVFRLADLAPPTPVTGFSSWPTPASRDEKGGARR